MNFLNSSAKKIVKLTRITSAQSIKPIGTVLSSELNSAVLIAKNWRVIAKPTARIKYLLVVSPNVKTLLVLFRQFKLLKIWKTATDAKAIVCAFATRTRCLTSLTLASIVDSSSLLAFRYTMKSSYLKDSALAQRKSTIPPLIPPNLVLVSIIISQKWVTYVDSDRHAFYLTTACVASYIFVAFVSAKKLRTLFLFIDVNISCA